MVKSRSPLFRYYMYGGTERGEIRLKHTGAPFLFFVWKKKNNDSYEENGVLLVGLQPRKTWVGKKIALESKNIVHTPYGIHTRPVGIAAISNTLRPEMKRNNVGAIRNSSFFHFTKNISEIPVTHRKQEDNLERVNQITTALVGRMFRVNGGSWSLIPKILTFWSMTGKKYLFPLYRKWKENDKKA